MPPYNMKSRIGEVIMPNSPILKSMYPSPPDMTSMEEASFRERLSPFVGELVGFRARPPWPRNDKRRNYIQVLKLR